MIPLQRSWAVLLTLTIAEAGAVFAQGEAELLVTVSRGNRASIDCIHSLTCNISYKEVGGKEQRCRYWQKLDVVRTREESEGTIDDHLFRGPKVLFLRSRQGSPDGAGITQNRSGPRRDPWTYGLFKHLGPQTEPPFYLFFDELLKQPHQLQSVKQIKDKGREIVQVLLSHKGAALELWFDPAVNYLVRKSILRASGGPLVVEREALGFKEISRGLYFPTAARTFTTGGKVATDYTVTFSEVEINRPIPDEILSLRFPPGIVVFDYTKNELHRTDADGEPTLPVLNKDGTAARVKPSAGLAPVEAQPPRKQSEGEQWRWSSWLLPASLLVLLTSGLLWFLQRRRTSFR